MPNHVTDEQGIEVVDFNNVCPMPERSDLIDDLKRWYYSGVPTKDDCLLRYLRNIDPYYVKHHETQLRIELGQMERRVD